MQRIGPNTASEPFLVLSDVHGNLTALRAVLAEGERRGARQVLVAGDLLLGGEQPLEVWHELQRIGAKCVRGPSDTALATVDASLLKPTSPEEIERAAQFGETQRALGDIVRRRLGELPIRVRIPMIDGRELLMVHGSPIDPFEGIEHDLDEEALVAALDDDPADIVVCGATHVPYQRLVREVHVVNVGSVGAAPEGRVAHFTVISPAFEGAQIEQGFVEY